MCAMSFTWHEYLQETGGEIAPGTLFKHVEASLESIIPSGQQLEVNYRKSLWWRATVVLTCGPLLSLRFVGLIDPKDNTHDFWLDISHSVSAKSLGWCQKHGISLTAPSCVSDNVTLSNVEIEKNSILEDVLESHRQFYTFDLLREGGYLECEHELDPLTVWPVKVIRNLGGRLHLSWFGSNPKKCPEFVLFYHHRRLHWLGWAKANSLEYKPPLHLPMDREISNIDTFLRGTPCALSSKYFIESTVPIHSFEIGWKLEAVNPRCPSQLRPATIVSIVNEMYFVIELDDLRLPPDRECVQFLCNAGCPLIMPANASYVRGIKLTNPPGWDETTFSWSAYLERFPTTYAPYESHFRCNRYEDLDTSSEREEFMLGLKLEAVNPLEPREICPATVTRMYGRLMWLHLDSEDHLSADLICDTKSVNVFPVGWCETTGHPLKPPIAYTKTNVTPPDDQNPDNKEDWCPKLYFNHRCYTGNYLSKSGVESLPRYVGPGQVSQVLEEVLTRLASVSYKPFRVLRDLEAENDNRHDLMRLVHLQVKFQKRLIGTSVEVANRKRAVEEFCRQVALLLEACPHLISSELIQSECSEGCSARIKSKFIEKLPTWKRRYVTSKPLTTLGLSYKALKVAASQSSDKDDKNVSDNNSESSSTSEESKCPEPPTKMQTRGVRLPSYVLLEKRKRKIVIKTEPGEVATINRPNQQEVRTPVPPPQPFHQHSNKNKFNSFQKSESMLQPHRMVYRRRPIQDPILLAGEIPAIVLKSNPLFWSTLRLGEYLQTTDCAGLYQRLIDEGVDGQAFMLLTLPIVQRLMGMRLDEAVKLCRHVVQLKRAFLEQFSMKDFPQE